MGHVHSAVIDQDSAAVAGLDLPWKALRGSCLLVTGATGMIPSAAVFALMAANRAHDLGLHIYALGRNQARAEAVFGPLLQQEDLTFVGQDVVQPLPPLPGLTHIIHGASAAQPQRHATDPVGTITANISGTTNLLEYCRDHGVGSFTLMSSAEIYGAVGPEIQMLTETDYGAIDILNPRACYSEGKRAAETLSAVYHYQYGIRHTIARFGHIYGPGMSMDDGRVQADFARDVFQGRDITLKSAGLAQRTYTYIADAVSGMLTALLRGEPGAYNVSDNAGLVSIRGLAEQFVLARPEKNLHLRFESETDQFATNKTQFQGLDSAKLQGLGWQPAYPLAQGIDRYLTHLEQTAGQ